MIIDELRRCRALRGELESLNERIARLRSAMEGCTAGPGGCGRGGETDKLAAGVARLDEMHSGLAARAEALERQIRACEDAVNGLPEQQRRVLRLRYFDGLSWRQVARRLGYSEKHVFYIHRCAIKVLENNVRTQ